MYACNLLNLSKGHVSPLELDNQHSLASRELSPNLTRQRDRTSLLGNLGPNLLGQEASQLINWSCTNVREWYAAHHASGFQKFRIWITFLIIIVIIEEMSDLPLIYSNFKTNIMLIPLCSCCLTWQCTLVGSPDLLPVVGLDYLILT